MFFMLVKVVGALGATNAAKSFVVDCMMNKAVRLAREQSTTGVAFLNLVLAKATIAPEATIVTVKKDSSASSAL
jgi:hypothetical protein